MLKIHISKVSNIIQSSGLTRLMILIKQYISFLLTGHYYTTHEYMDYQSHHDSNNTPVFPIVTYGREKQAVGKADHKRIASFEKWCQIGVLRISFSEHIEDKTEALLGRWVAGHDWSHYEDTVAERKTNRHGVASSLGSSWSWMDCLTMGGQRGQKGI